MVSGRAVFGFVIWILYFLLVNFEPTMANIFIGIFIGSIILFQSDKIKTFVFERPGNNKLKSVGKALIAVAAFYIISAVVLGILKLTGTLSIESTAALYSDFLGSMMAQYSPALADSAFFTLVSWGTQIPIVESFAFFVVLFEFLVNIVFKEHPNIKKVKTWFAAIIVSGVFMYFHMTAKGIGNDPALLMTFIFALISVVLVMITKQALEAVIFHIVVNSSAIIIGMKLTTVFASPLIIIIGVSVIIYFAIRNVKLNIRA